MAYNTKFSKDEIKRIGHRLQAARVLTGMNREEFAEKNNLPCMSIKNWEIGRALPRQEGIIAALGALKESGVFASMEWILYGSGSGPNYSETTTFEQKENSEDLVDQQINLFKKAQRAQGHNPIVTTIQGDEMSPVFKNGDKLGGIVVLQDDVKRKIINAYQYRSPWLVTSVNGQFIPVWLYFNGDKWLTNTSKQVELKECLSPTFAMIKWHYSIGEDT